MVDNTELNAGSGGDTIATDDIAGIKHQRVKVQHGADGSATDVSTASPLPVDLRADNLAGDIDVNINTDTVGLATAANQLPDGHNVTVDNAAGAAAVNIQDGGNSITVDGTVNLDGTQPNASHTRNEAFSESVAVGGELDDTTPVVATEGNVSPARITAQRAFHANLRNNAGTEVGTASDPVRTDPTGSTAQPVSGTVNIGTFPDNEPFDMAQVSGVATDTGTGVSTPGTQRVVLANDQTVVPVSDNAGSLTVDQATAANLNAQVSGAAAHDAAASGNPVLVAGQMETQEDSAPGTRASTDSDAMKLAATDGAIYTISGGPQQWSYHSDGSTALTDATVHAAPGAGLSLYVGTIAFSSGAATAINVFFEEITTTVLGPYYLEAVAGRGAVIKFDPPKKISANTALTVTTSASIAHSVDVTGYIAPG